MDFAEQLIVIQQAQGDPAMLALATVDLAYPDLPDGEKAKLKEALEAAAIPHWCDETILAVLLQIPQKESAARLAQLRGLNVVEAFTARGNTAVNVHETTRLALRKRMSRDRESDFLTLSGRAAVCFVDDLLPSGRIEWLYHLLCAEPDRGTYELEKLYRAWFSTAHPEDVYALALALSELKNSQLIESHALAWTLIAIAWSRQLRGENAQLANAASQVLFLAKKTKDQVAEGQAQSLLGDALQAQGQLGAAQAAFNKLLVISQRLVKQDPNNVDWQRDLAEAYNRVGNVLEDQGQLEAAQEAFDNSLVLCRRLVKLDSSNVGWQKNLAEAYSWMGDVLQAQNKLKAAEAAFNKFLVISRRLVKLDPSNTSWQKNLAVAYSRRGDVLKEQGQLEAAQIAFDQYLAIRRGLVEIDSSNADWQKGLGVAHNRVGGLLEAQGQLKAAQASFEQSLGISQWLTEQDPNDTDWQRELAVAYGRVGNVLQIQGKFAEAKEALNQSLIISERLVKKDPSNAIWQQDLEVAVTRIASANSIWALILSFIYKMRSTAKSLWSQ